MSNRLSEELRQIRRIRSVSLREVENGTGISNAYLSQLETGKAGNPSPHVLLKLADFYCVPYESLMEAAGYLQPRQKVERGNKKKLSGTQAALLSAPLDEDEQEKVTEFLEFLRLQRRNRSREPVSSPINSVVRRPDSESAVSEIADRALRKAGALGRLPTPINELIEAAGVDEVQDPEAVKERFLTRLAEQTRAGFLSLWQKLRGIADLRERVIYVPNKTTQPRVLFAKAHELGHQLIPWQKTNLAYQDDDLSLSPEAQDLFDVEANFFAAEVIFQGRRFAKRLRDYLPSFDTVFDLAQKHGASRHATLRRYVEEHDEALAAIPYWPSIYAADEKGFAVLRIGKIVGSPRFIQRYAGIRLPREIRSGHPWVAERDLSQVCEGEIRLDSDTGRVRFEWQSWWNGYSLLVLLRRKPALSLVGQLMR